jgi:hypothetical protein
LRATRFRLGEKHAALCHWIRPRIDANPSTSCGVCILAAAKGCEANAATHEFGVPMSKALICRPALAVVRRCVVSIFMRVVLLLGRSLIAG